MTVKPVANSLLLAVQITLVLLTSLATVLITHETRRQFALLEETRAEQRSLLEGWGKLMLEVSAFSSPSRVERVARDELQMIRPEGSSVMELN